MPDRTVLWFLYIAMIVVAVVLALVSWSAFQQASVIVEWTTASELETAGFNVYRSTSANEPFERINASLIPASPDPLTGGSYRYEDDSVEPGQVYYYELEDVDLEGNFSRFGPIEIRAERGGIFEMILAAVLFTAAVLGFWFQIRSPVVVS